MSAQKLQPPRGTRDFYPEDLRLRSWLFEHFRAVSRQFGFEEVDAPIVEHEELFTRKAGEEIVDQLYHFELHDRRLALRPEFTPSLARMVLARRGALRFPIRWFAIPQCWRYERMTRGRKREHYQWNMDVWGEPGVGAEAELIAAAFQLCDRVRLARGDVRMRLSSRALLEDTLRATVLRERADVFPALCVAIDKLEKIGADAVVALLCASDGAIGLPEADARFVVDWLALRTIDDAVRAAPAESAAAGDLRRLIDLLDDYGLSDRVAFDASVVRGLAYYTGIVFELFDARGELRALCGGGRYDGLLETLGGPRVPAAGFGMGDVVIGELLADRGLQPDTDRRLDAVVAALGDAERRAAIRLAGELRAADQSVEVVLGEPRLKRVLQDADKAGAARVYWIGAEEREKGVAAVRDLATGKQTTRPLGA